MKQRFIVFGGISGAVAVALGALGAHYLKSLLAKGLVTETNLQTFETAVKYQMYHAIVLLILAALFDNNIEDKWLVKSGRCFMIGMVLFSGSLYLISLSSLLNISNLKVLGPITPIGGLFLITGWILLVVAGMNKQKHQ